MSLHQFYENRIQSLRAELTSVTKKESYLSFLRLFSFLIPIVLFFAFLNTSVIVSVFIQITGFVIFGSVLMKHLRAGYEKENLSHLVAINEKELASLDGHFQNFPDGHEYLLKDHYYAGDLDIFGKSSLFQYLNRTTTKPGSERLAEWLDHPAVKDEILKRQEAVAELKDLVDWRQQLISVGYRFSGSLDNPEPVRAWLEEKPVFLPKRGLYLFVVFLSILSVLSLAGYFLGLPSAIFVLVLAVNFLINYKWFPAVSQIHQNVSKTVDMLKSYEAVILLLEKQQFRTAKLIELQKIFLSNNIRASFKVRRLFRLVNKLDYRLNFMVSIFLNLFYFWDIRQCIHLEKWKAANSESVERWFSAMAEFEALISLSNLYFNNPEWVFPDVLEEFFKLQAEEAGHPMIPKNKRITNSLSVDSRGVINIITGSNMSGKSTFLRTCGVNIVLAMTGAPVCAKTFKVSRVMVYTSMRIVDSLEENTSSFYAELKRLAGIIQSVEKDEPVFLLLDEILRGTNSNDRHIGSVALIKQLLKYKAVGIIATHDLGLSMLEEEFPGEIFNHNFDVKIEGDELYFDYKLNRGTCKSLNASILMRKMGIEM